MFLHNTEHTRERDQEVEHLSFLSGYVLNPVICHCYLGEKKQTQSCQVYNPSPKALDVETLLLFIKLEYILSCMLNLTQRMLSHSSEVRNAWGNASLTEGCQYQILVYQSWNQDNDFLFLGSGPALLNEGLNVARQGRLWTGAVTRTLLMFPVCRDFKGNLRMKTSHHQKVLVVLWRQTSQIQSH